MADELYVNKRGFKCVRSQLAKTDGRDPQEHAAAQRNAEESGQHKDAFVKTLKVRAPEYVEE